VRQGFRLLFVIAAVPVVSGCFYFPGTFGASGSSSSSSSSETNVRGAVPAIEAYYADNNTYSGVTLEALQQYDHGVADVRVVTANDETYCLESATGGEAYSKAGPAAEIVAGACSVDSPPVDLPPPAENLHAAVEGMEVFHSARGTYEGVTFRDLQALVPGLKPLRVVDAGTDSFCLESTVEGQTWSARQSGDVGIGAC
jgi:hypothetical protein